MGRNIRIIISVVFVTGGILALAVTSLPWKRAPSLKTSPVQTLPSSQQNSFLQPTSTDNAWNTYRNTKYGFSFQYPTDFELYGGLAVGDISQPFYEDDGNEVLVYPKTEGENGESGTLDIIVHDKGSTTSDEYGDAPGFWAAPLPSLMLRIETLADADKADKPLGTLMTTTIASQTAYQFTTENGIGWNGAGEIPGGENLWIFMSASDSILEAVVPDTPIFKRILQSIQLVDAGT